MQENTDDKHPVFPNLNGLRTLGALAVVVYHAHFLNREIWGSFFRSAFFRKSEIAVSRGHHAIELFFIISGFLITYLMLHEQKTKGKINIGHFLARRFLRVWPLYFFIVLFGFFVFPYLPYGIATIHEFWRFGLFLSNFDEIIHGLGDRINFLSATWTVSVEEQFYLAWALLFGTFTFRRKWLLPAFFIVIILFSLVFRWFHLNDQRLLHLHTLSVMSDLALGGLAGILAFSSKAKRIFSDLPGIIILLAYSAFICLLLFEDHIFTGKLFVLSRIVPGLFLVFIVLEQVFSVNSFYKADKLPGFRFAGKRAYGIYMYHCIVIYYLGIFFHEAGLTIFTGCYFVYLLLVLIITYALSLLSFRFIESPFLRLQSRFR